MDYKKMCVKELLHLVSNQVSEQTVTEQNKLVIQDCCKHLFEKMTTKYVKVRYQKWRKIKKRYKCPVDHLECPISIGDMIGDAKHPEVECDCAERFGGTCQKVTWHLVICEIEPNSEKSQLFLPNRHSGGQISIGAMVRYKQNGFYIEGFSEYDLNIMGMEPL